MPQDRRPVRLAAAVFFFVAAALALTLAPCGTDRAPPRAKAPDVRPATPVDRREPSVRRETPPPVEAKPAELPPPASAPESTPKVTKLLRVRVLDSSGAPASAAAVVVTDHFAPDEAKHVPLAQGATDADGRVEFRLPKSNYVVHAAGRGEAAVLGDIGNFLGDGDTPSRDVELRLGAVLSVRGAVRLPDGTAVAGAEVTGVFERAPLSHWRFFARTKTGADGRFEFASIPRAQFQRAAPVSVARGAGHWSETVAVRAEDADAGDVVVVVQPTCRLSGRCVDERGDAMAGVNAQFYGERWNTGGVTDDAGRFAFDVPRGVGFVEVTGDKPRGRRIEDVRATGRAVDLGDVRLEPPPPK